MTGSITSRAVHAAALWLAALVTPAQAQAPRWIPEAGSQGYRYELVTHIPNLPATAYRLDYDLVSDGRGGLVAVVKAAAHMEGGGWRDAEIDADCRAALHATGNELARVTLSPVAPGAAATLGPAFVADCAPADILYPIMDILNVALIQVGPQFRLAELVSPGDSRRFAGYATSFDRLDTVAKLEATGGTVTFAALAPGRATIDWASDPLKLTMVRRGAYNGADITLTGSESFLFRLEIDPVTGVLLSAATTYDELDMTMTLPGGYSQPLRMTRDVKIAARPGLR